MIWTAMTAILFVPLFTGVARWVLHAPVPAGLQGLFEVGVFCLPAQFLPKIIVLDQGP